MGSAEGGAGRGVLPRMMAWLLAGGARSAVGAARDRDGAGSTHALDPIAASSEVLAVPLEYILTREIAKASSVGQNILAARVRLRSEHTFLAAYLLQEKRDPRSFWRPYLDALPASVRGMPTSFDEGELAALEGSSALPRIRAKKRALAAEYEDLRARVAAFEHFTLAEFIWARHVVMSRVFGLVIDGHRTQGLVPMADMLNHRRGRQTSWTYDDGLRAFVIIALRDFAAGAEVHDSYGRKCNVRLFLNYGFALADNPDNEAHLAPTIARDDPWYARKLAAQSGPARGFDVTIDHEHDGAARMLSFLRLAAADGDETARLSAASRYSAAACPPLGARNEAAALALLAAACEAALARFETTLEDDDALLAGDTLTPNLRTCVLVRRGEKRVLRRYLALAREATPLLALGRAELDAVFAEQQARREPIDPYLVSVVAGLARRRPRRRTT